MSDACKERRRPSKFSISTDDDGQIRFMGGRILSSPRRSRHRTRLRNNVALVCQTISIVYIIRCHNHPMELQYLSQFHDSNSLPADGCDEGGEGKRRILKVKIHILPLSLGRGDRWRASGLAFEPCERAEMMPQKRKRRGRETTHDARPSSLLKDPEKRKHGNVWHPRPPLTHSHARSSLLTTHNFPL